MESHAFYATRVCGNGVGNVLHCGVMTRQTADKRISLMTFLIKPFARLLRDIKTFFTTEPVPHWTEYLSGRH